MQKGGVTLVINFAKVDLHKCPNFIVRNFDGKALGVLGHILRPTASFKYNEISEIHFEYPSQANGVELSEYDLLAGMRIIDVQGYGQFLLHNPVETDNGIVKIKECTGYSLEYEFNNKYLSIEEGTYNFWNPFSPDSTILGIIMSEMPSWGLGTVSSDLIGKYRTFSADSVTIYDFMKSDLQNTYACIFDFDTYNRTINVRSVNDRISRKPVYISTSNLAKEIEIEENLDELITVLDVNGAEGVDIRSVNPMGENRIYNLDAYMTEEYFSADMITKWNNWKSAFENNQTTYYSLVVAQNMQITRYATETAVLGDLKGDLTLLESKKAVLLQTIGIDNSAQSELNTVNSQIRSKNNEIESQETTLTQIQTQINNYIKQLKQINEATSFSTFFTDREMLILDRYFKCGALTDSSFVADNVDSYTSESSITRGLSSVFRLSNCTEVRKINYAGSMTFYSVRGGTISENSSVLKLNAEIVNATLQVNSDNSFIMSVYLNRGSLKDEEFPSGTLSVTGTLRSSVSASDNSLQFTTSSATAYMIHEVSEYQRMSIAWDLFEYGKGMLDKKAAPTYKFSVSSANFFALDDFLSFAKEYALGEQVYLRLSKGTIAPVAVGVTIDFDDLTSLELEFGSEFHALDEEFTLQDILDKSISMGNSLNLNQYNYSNFVTSGAHTKVKDFMESALDTMKNMIISGANNEITIDPAGLRCRKYDENTGTYNPKQIWIAHNALMFTNDNWNTATIGIGEFVDENFGSLYGIVAPAIVGTILAGNNLIIESQKQDGGVAVFKVDAEGASLHNASFNLYGTTGGRIDLGSIFGIVGGANKNTLFNYDSKGQPTGVRTSNGRSISRINNLYSNETPNANFWIDMYGDVYLKGKVDATSGVFRGSISVGGTESDPNFYVDSKGNMRAKNAEVEGTINANRFLINGQDALSGGKIKENFLHLEGINSTIESKDQNLRSVIQQTASQIRTEVNNKVSGFNSKIEQSEDNIRFEVTSQISDFSSEMSQEVGLIRWRVENLDGKYSELQQTVDGFTFTGEYVRFYDLTDGMTEISGDNIKTGTINAEYVTLGTDDGGFCCSSGYDGIRDTYGAMMYGGAGRWGDYYFFVSNRGTRMSGGGTHFYVSSSGAICSDQISVWSDKRFKNTILYNIDKYEELFYKLNPASFCLNSSKNNKRHIGFIAQDIEEARLECHLSKDELAFLNILEQEDENGELQQVFSIQYSEIIPLCVHMIKKLSNRIDNLEKQLKEM